MASRGAGIAVPGRWAQQPRGTPPGSVSNWLIRVGEESQDVTGDPAPALTIPVL